MAEIKFHYLNALPQNPNSKELYFIKDTSSDKGKLYRGSQLIAETSAAEIESLANNVATALEAIQQGYETKTDATAKLTEAKEYTDDAIGKIPSASTTTKGIVKLSDATNSTSTSLAATANAVKKAYDLANKTNIDKGSATQPVYFNEGVPVAINYTIEKSVPSNAKFTDTTYTNATTSKDGLMSMEDKTKIDNLNVAYGTCSTAAATAEKVVTLSNSNWQLKTGALITVKFSETNSAEAPTLNVNGTGAKSIYYNNAVYTGASSYGGYANRHITYQYDGANWVFISWGYDTNSDTKVTQAAAITTAGEYPIILGYNTSTSTVTNTVNKTSTLKYNPNTKILTAPTFKGNLVGNADSATEATSATKATQDASGNIITTTYETKTDAAAKLATAKEYTDDAKEAAIKHTDDMVNAIVGEGAVETLDTIGEISAAITANQNILDTLNDAVGKKANQTDLTSHVNNSAVHITADERTKLQGIKDGAEVNQNAFSNVKVGTSTIAADSKTDILTLEAGDFITLTADTTNDKVIFNVQSGSTSQKGVIQLSDAVNSTSTSLGATANAVKKAYDLANGKQATITGAATTVTDSNLTASRVLISNTDGKIAVSGITSTKLGYLTDVTSNIQAQLNSKQATITGAATTITGSNLTASRALISNADGKVAVSAITSTELGYLDNLTGNIQEKFNALDALAAGSATQPIYFSAGKPIATTYALNKTVPSNAVFTDTLNTAGSTNSSSKLFLIGTTSQAASGQTYSHDTAYVGTDGHLYSDSKQVVNLSGTQALTNKTYNGYTLAAACAKGVTDSTSASALGTGSNLVTERDVYYGLANINGARQTSGVGIYAPASAGTSGYILESVGSGAPEWVATKSINAGSANKLNTNAGDASTPVFFSEGVPEPCTSLDLNTSGNAATATALTTSAGDSSTPVYFSGGKPVVCTSLDLNTTGSAAKLTTARSIDLSTAVEATATNFDGSGNITIPVTEVKEAYLSWGGKNLVGSVSPVGASLSSEHSANRLAYLDPAALTFEYSDNGGSSWSAMSISDATKVNFVTTDGTFYVGNASSVTTNHRSRVTITAQNGTTGYVYTRPRKMLINVSTAGHGLKVTVEVKQGTSGASWNTLGTYELSGWSGWNEIPLNISTFGGSTSQTTNYWYLRLTFANTSVHSSYATTKSSIISLRLFGDTSWTSTSNMGKLGHLYSYDYQQNATFPAKVTATEFVGSVNPSNLSAAVSLAKGGTGTALTYTANSIIRFSSSGQYFSSTPTANGAFYATSTNGSPLFGTLPIAQGGTGATTASGILTNLGISATATELNYTDGVTSNIQTQLNNKSKVSIVRW